MTKPLREDVRRVSRLTSSRWSRWYVALVPEARTGKNAEKYERRKKGNYGFIFSKIKEGFDKKGYDNGIYELCVSKRKRSKKKVVYIGAAHRDGPGSIDKRISEYWRGGSHKDPLINRALKLGYALLVRAKNIPGSKKHVYECEDRYLAEYEYAWNKRKNGPIRKNFPPP